MRLLTFSFLRGCKFKLFYNQFLKRKQSEYVQKKVPLEDKTQGDRSLIDADSWPPTEQAELRAAALSGMAVYPDFVNAEEEASLLAELEPVLKRMRYEYDHWDHAIHGYRETERSTWRAENEAVIQRVRALAFSGNESEEPLPHAHVLDLAPAGHIKPHVDAVRFCGSVIAGLCLASSAVMKLEHTEHKHLHFSAYLKQRSLYIMSGAARYSFSHAVLGGEQSAWRGERLVKRRRVALICRSKPPPPAAAPDSTL